MDRLEAEGFTPAHVTQLGQYGNLAGFKAVLDGTAKIKPTAEDTTRVITINETTIVVNLGATPRLPFNGAAVEKHTGAGWVIVEKRLDGLYVNERKVILYLSRQQKSGKLHKGYELREELSGKLLLNANLLDALYENTHLIPEDWKKDEDGKTRYIFFWATIYRNANGNLCVRYLFWIGTQWYSYYYWLDDGWRSSGPSAVCAS